MPTFELSDASGTYHVDAPDETAALGALHAMNGTNSVGVGEDLLGVAKTAPQRMIAGLAGIPADLAHLYADKNDPNPLGSEALGQKMGVYNAQTIPGQTLQKAVDFAPAVIGGPEGMASKLLTRVAAPAIASEIGGQVAGPYGEVAGALAGGVGAPAAARKFQAMAAARSATDAIPSGEELLKTGSGQFNQARDMNLQVKPDFATNTAADMRATLKDFDSEDASVKDVFRKIDRLEGLGKVESQSPAGLKLVDAPEGGVYAPNQIKKGEKYFKAVDPEGNVAAEMLVKIDGTKASIQDILNPNAPREAGIGTLGNAGLKNLIRQFQEQHPDVTELNGKRVSGSRMGGGYSLLGEPTSISVDLPKNTASQGQKTFAPVLMNDIENVRKQLSKLRISPDASTREAAKRAQEVLTKNQMALSATDAISGDASLYSKTMRDAVGNYGAGKRSMIIQGKQDLADLNAGTAGSGANGDNATRQAIKQLARPINNTNVPVAKRLGFNDAEVDAIKKAAMGTIVGNTARFLGKGAPTGIVSAAGGLGLGHMAGGPIGAVALPTAGYIAKKIGDLSTKRAVAALDSLVRSRSPLANQVAAQLPPLVVQQLPAKTQRLLRSLALAAPGIRNQISQPVGQPATQ